MKKLQLTILVVAFATLISPSNTFAGTPSIVVADGDGAVARYMSNSNGASNLQSLIDRAKAAIKACNESEFNSAMRQIGQMKQQLEGLSRATPNEASSSFVMDPADARKDANAAAWAENGLNSMWAAAQPCGEPAEEEPKTALRNDSTVDGTQKAESPLKVSAHGSKGNIIPEKSSYLGTRNGAGPDILNFVTNGSRWASTAVGLSFAYYLFGYNMYNAPNAPNVYNTYNTYNVMNFLFFPFSGLRLIGDVEKGNSKGSETYGNLNPRGANLLIPGVGVGPNGAGFVLPGPNNQITNARYEAEYDWHAFFLGFEADARTSNPRLSVTPRVGVRYRESETRNRFTGDIPVFVRSFDYSTKTEVRSISPTLGLDVGYQVTPHVKVFAGGEFSYDLNKGSGEDSLDFTGFANQTAATKSDRNTHSHSVKAGATFRPNPDFPLDFTVQGEYGSIGNVPVMKVRDGMDVSDFSYEPAREFTGTIRTTFRF